MWCMRQCKESIEGDLTLFDCLMKKEEVTSSLGEKELKALCDPFNYLGASQQMVEDVLAIKN